jgi:hypothetical protein
MPQQLLLFLFFVCFFLLAVIVLVWLTRPRKAAERPDLGTSRKFHQGINDAVMSVARPKTVIEDHTEAIGGLTRCENPRQGAKNLPSV